MQWIWTTTNKWTYFDLPSFIRGDWVKSAVHGMRAPRVRSFSGLSEITETSSQFYLCHVYNSFRLLLDDYGRLSWVYQTQVRQWVHRSHSMNEWRWLSAKDSLDLCLTSEGTINTAWRSHDRKAVPRLGMPPRSFPSQWLNMPWWTASPELEHRFIWSANLRWPVFIGNRRKRGRPDPVSYPSEQNTARLRRS
jgi:hypothetical protein